MLQAMRQSVGDTIWELAGTASDEINASEVAFSMRSNQLSDDRWRGLIAATYPVVVGFNRALIRSMAKIDNVKDSSLIKALSEQLKEEQMHNDMWRAMLTEFDVDHVALWDDLGGYLSQFSKDELDDMTAQVLEALSSDSPDFKTSVFRNASFPDPSLALFHHMYAVAEDPEVGFWAHFASQSAIECTIYGFVSESVYPPLHSNSPLNRGPRSTAWWREHARQSSTDGRRSTEEKHLQIAKAQLNRLKLSEQEVDTITDIVKDSLTLFSAAIRWHECDKGGMWDAGAFVTK